MDAAPASLPSRPELLAAELAYIFDADDNLPIDEELSAALEPIDD